MRLTAASYNTAYHVKTFTKIATHCIKSKLHSIRYNFNLKVLLGAYMWETALKSSAMGFAALNEDGRIAACNPKFCQLLGLTDTETAIGCLLLDYVAERWRASATDLRLALTASSPTRLELRQDNETLSLQVAGQSGELRMLVLDSLPKTDANSINSALYRDPLTGLGNRLLLDESIATWQPTDPEAMSLALIMIDLDRFKQVNDTLGHGAGDTLLKLVAKRIKSATRTTDIVVRMGGDEFVVLHTIGLQPIGAESVAKRIIEMMSRLFLIDGQQVNIGASVGIAAINHGTESITDLLKHADLALYEAKAAGRGNYQFFEPALAERAMERRNLEVDLRRALGLKEFFLLYQPQVNMETGALQGFEALIRWQHKTRGLLSPLAFIPMAEELGEIHLIGEWILRTACKEAMRWGDNLTVAVNVSPIQFDNGRIVDVVREILSSTGLPAETSLGDQSHGCGYCNG